MAHSVDFHSPTRYSFRGEPRDVEVIGGDNMQNGLTPEEGDPPLMPYLAGELYGRLYCRSRAGRPLFSDIPTRRDFANVLSEANVGTGTWERGWRFESMEPDGSCLVVRDGIRFSTPASGVRAAGALRTGFMCRVRVPKELRQLFPHFYFAIGDAEVQESELEDAGGLVRLYWHLTSESAPHYIRQVTEQLNGAGIPFKTKVISDPALYDRADAGVLYVGQKDLRQAWPHIGNVYEAVHPRLRRSVPMLTKRLAPGLGLAEDPGSGDTQSFGSSRCLAIARGLWSAWVDSAGTRDPREGAISGLLRAGVDPERPYLNPGSTDRYEPPPGIVKEGEAPPSLETTPEVSSNGASAPPTVRARQEDGALQARLRGAAVRIGEHLCESAHWDSDHERCNWTGRHDDVSNEPEIKACVGALGPDLYSGSTGVALFLGHLYSSTGQAEFAEAAHGALRRSIDYLAHHRSAASPFSFYAGWLGVAYVAARLVDAGVKDIEPGLHEAMAWVGDAEIPATFDVIAGLGGAIPALLWLSDRPRLERCVEMATRCGEALVAAALWEGAACSWPPATEAGGPPPLGGLSHGVSGIGIALLELYARTGVIDYLHTARGAFRFEDRLFSPSAGNWVDTRFEHVVTDAGAQGTCRAAWCHGAPGIGLARARAAELDKDESDVHRRMAGIALSTTLQTMRDLLPKDNHDASLCHGIGGLGEIALTLGDMLGKSCRGEVVATAAELVGRYGSGDAWPSGLHVEGSPPALMIGTSGIGYHLLRASSPDAFPPALAVYPRTHNRRSHAKAKARHGS